MIADLHLILSDLQEDDLAIVYYIGHGESHANEALLLCPTLATDEQPPVSFIRVRRETIDRAKADVLILLDCCYASGAAIGEGKELIAATAYGSTAYNGPKSFSSNLIQQIQHTATTKQILTTPQLYARLATKPFILDANGQPELASTPIHVQNYDTHRMPIYLAPLFPSSGWVAARHPLIFAQPVNVLLGVHLADANHANLQEMRWWLTRSRPDSVHRVELVNLVPSNAAILFVKMALDVWYSLKDHPAISFIAFERNLHLPMTTSVQLPSSSKFGGYLFGRQDPGLDPFKKYQDAESPFANLKENIPPRPS
jgi:hypothetical protein